MKTSVYPAKLTHDELLKAFLKLQLECDRAKKGRHLAVVTCQRKNTNIILRSAKIHAREIKDKIIQENIQLREEKNKALHSKHRQLVKFKKTIKKLQNQLK